MSDWLVAEALTPNTGGVLAPLYEAAARGALALPHCEHRREPGLIVATEPYHVVDVELEGGHRLLMTTVAATATPPGIGDPAHVVFRRVGDVSVPALAIPER